MAAQTSHRSTNSPTGILFDLDGVLYVGEEAVPGAAAAIAWIADAGVPHLFLTNTTSRPRAEIVDRLATLGFKVDTDRILTPAVAAAAWLRQHAEERLALFVPEATAAEFGAFDHLAVDAESGATAVIIGDLGPRWDFQRLNRAFRLLMQDPAPVLVALGMTRYWRAQDGLRLDTGPFVRALEYATGIEALVTGKPAAAFFNIAAEQLGLAAADLLMVGDDIRGDIEGAQRAGLKAALVRTGKFAARDLELGITPDAVLPSVRELPDWWAENPA